VNLDLIDDQMALRDTLSDFCEDDALLPGG
jgi:hypothetical protein